jgi:hypothetical protein
MKYLQNKRLKTDETDVYSHCNMCNISIYFCKINIKYLQHISETYETLETYACNMCLAHVTLLLGQIEAHRRRSSTLAWRYTTVHGARRATAVRATRWWSGVTRSSSSHLFAGASVVEARQLVRGGRGK